MRKKKLGVRAGRSFSFFPFLTESTAWLLSSSSLLLLLVSSAPLLLPTLLPASPWGLSSPSPSPPPCLPTFPGRCWKPPGCCAAGGCLAGSLHRHLHLLICWEARGGSVRRRGRSERSRCRMLRGRSSRTHGDTSTRTARTWGCPCSYGELDQNVLEHRKFQVRVWVVGAIPRDDRIYEKCCLHHKFGWF